MCGIVLCQIVGCSCYYLLLRFDVSIACEQAPEWGIGRRQKSSMERRGEKEREGACGHSFDAAVPPPCN